MRYAWIQENPPHWDRSKARIVGESPGIFGLGPYRDGDMLPGEWWRVEENGAVLGFGFMDCTWGDAEILLAVDASRRREGVGTFILERLAEEALARGVNYLYNEIRATHPDPERLARWLENRGFKSSRDDRLLRRSVKP